MSKQKHDTFKRCHVRHAIRELPCACAKMHLERQPTSLPQRSSTAGTNYSRDLLHGRRLIPPCPPPRYLCTGQTLSGQNALQIPSVTRAITDDHGGNTSPEHFTSLSRTSTTTAMGKTSRCAQPNAQHYWRRDARPYPAHTSTRIGTSISTPSSPYHSPLDYQ